jgi:hypothetical protein
MLTSSTPKAYPPTDASGSSPQSKRVGNHLSVSYEAWIAADPFRGGTRVLITGPQGFERVVQFDADEQPAEITRRVRETLDE